MTVTETPRLLDPAAEVWALEYPGRLSDSALAHLHRELQEALPEKRVVVVQDGARFRSLSSLDAAWAEVEAVLPNGWAIDNLRHTAMMDQRWQAEAGSRIGPVIAWNRVRTVIAEGPTPAAALRALAAALRKPVTA